MQARPSAPASAHKTAGHEDSALTSEQARATGAEQAASGVPLVTASHRCIRSGFSQPVEQQVQQSDKHSMWLPPAHPLPPTATTPHSSAGLCTSYAVQSALSGLKNRLIGSPAPCMSKQLTTAGALLSAHQKLSSCKGSAIRFAGFGQAHSLFGHEQQPLGDQSCHCHKQAESNLQQVCTMCKIAVVLLCFTYSGQVCAAKCTVML